MADAYPAKLVEELHRAKQSLSEVIDECVFVERQRDQIEQELTAELRERDRLVSDTCASLVSLTEYLSLLERRVILPALGTFSAVVRKVPAVAGTRSSTLERVEESLSANNSTSFRGILARMPPISGDIETGIRQMLLDTADFFSIEEAYVLLRALLEEKDKLVEKLNDTLLHMNDVVLKLRASRSVSVNHGDELRELRQKVAALTQELMLREDEKRGVLHRLALLEEDLSRERKSVGELHRLRETVARQDRTIELLRLSSGSPTRLQPGSLASDNNGAAVGGVNEEELIPQLKANEMTIGALNKELAILEENYRVLERRSEREREELQSELAVARRRHQAEQEECNTVLGRVTMELEQLVAENAQLKRRLKQMHAKKSIAIEGS
ncbi:uncharacterized protein Tco025E_07904 [Trypanosoma conorhini]|uniref:Uncharacterized protein n=1 Tax=Trypanosoma conorhini TaxID=83891 RepID=A0A422NH35_9TRYP|nr:uncharacterized protein Tco025E_07904 [Trypanosoma conorhini]RNF04764.1 hypothetical protein Tco025E_07904 [Trypanosoma conorhini]